MPNGSQGSDSPAADRGARLAPFALPLLGILAYVAFFTVRQLADPDLPAFVITNDLDAYFYPCVAFMHRSLLAGELPLWNPYQLAGVPFLALHSPGATYLPLVVLSLLPPATALVVDTVLHLALAGIFTALFVRRLGVGSGGCLAAAIAFTGSAALVGAVHNTAYLSTFVWLPASFWAADRLVEGRSARRAAVLALFLFLSFTAGYSQGFVYTVQAMGLYVLFRVATTLRGGERAQSIAWLGLAGVLALGLVAVQLLPLLEHAASSARSLGGMSFDQATVQSARTTLGEVLTGRGEWPFGLPALMVPLAFAALVRTERRRDALFFAVLLLLAFDFAHGDESLVFRIYFHLPLGSVFRIPTRICFVFQFCAAVLLGLGYDAILAWMRPRAGLARATAVLMLAFLAWDVWLRAPLLLRFAPLAAPEALDESRGLADFDSGYDRIFIEGLERVPRKLGTIHGIYVVSDYDPLLPGRYLRYFGIPPGEIWHGWLSIVRPMPPAERLDAELLDLMSVKYYFGREPPPKRLRDVGRPIDREGAPPLIVRTRALPRAYLVHDVVRAPSEAEAIARVRAGDFDPYRQAVVDVDPGPIEPRMGGSRESARIVAYRGSRAEVEATCWTSCLLVLTDLYHPGWRATCDGAECGIVEVNALYRGVRLPAGEHRVVFTYHPDAFYRGAAISCAAGAVVLLLLVLPAWRARRGRAASG